MYLDKAKLWGKTISFAKTTAPPLLTCWRCCDIAAIGKRRRRRVYDYERETRTPSVSDAQTHTFVVISRRVTGPPDVQLFVLTILNYRRTRRQKNVCNRIESGTLSDNVGFPRRRFSSNVSDAWTLPGPVQDSVRRVFSHGYYIAVARVRTACWA